MSISWFLYLVGQSQQYRVFNMTNFTSSTNVSLAETSTFAKDASKVDHHHGCTEKAEPAVVLSSATSEKLSDQRQISTLEGTHWPGALTVSV